MNVISFSKKKTTDALQTIPGVGVRVAADLHALGVHQISDLKGKSPESLYDELIRLQGPVDRCMLYTFRCAVYYASHSKHDPEKLKWWNWKDSLFN